MRHITFIILYLLSSAVCCASIKTVENESSKDYFVQAGAFSVKSNADLLSQTLAHSLHQATKIEQKNNLYLVKVGPLKTQDLANSIKKALENKAQSEPQTQVSEVDSSLKASKIEKIGLKLAQNAATSTAPKAQQKEVSSSSKPQKVKPSRLWNLRNADIRSVIAEVSRQTGKNFVIDPRVQGKISIVSSTPMSPKAVYQVFLSMLQVSGYAAIPYGDVTKIVPNIDAKTQAADLLSQLKSPPGGDEMVVEVVPVRYVPSEQLVPVLRPLMPQWSNVSAYGPSNMLILSGRANNIKRLANIIRQVDSSSANGIDMVSLRYALANDVVDTLKNLLQTVKGASTSRAKPTVAADNRSNSILISGTKTDRIRIRLLIEKLDRRNANGMSGNTAVVYLHYQRAEDMVNILAGIAKASFSGQVGVTIGTTTRPELDTSVPTSGLGDGSGSSSFSSGTTGTSQTNTSLNQQATPNTQSSSNQSEGDSKPSVQLIAEPNTNSVIISGPQALIRTLKSVTRQLDIKPAQLLIEAIVAEINEADANNLGIEWGSIPPSENGMTDDATFNARRGLAILNTATSLSNFEARIYALANERKANILSTPSVVVLDNRQAKILVGKQVSITSTSQVANTTGTPFNTFDRKDVALHLFVRPQVTRGTGIQMQIDLANNTLDPPNQDTTNIGANPVFNISSINTSVHVQSGDVIVLGGLNQDALANSNNKTPVLGDIPGLGRFFFKHNIRSRDKRLLMVFIRPILITNPKDALHVSGEKYDDIRDFQLNFIRNEEMYNKKNDRSLMDNLRTAQLPLPFTTKPKTK